MNELLAKLRSIENQLSPENLCCDGEASRAEVNKRFSFLSKQRAEVIKKLGYEPTFEEMYKMN